MGVKIWVADYFGMNALRLTHPDDATLVDPLFACGGKRVWEGMIDLLITACGALILIHPRFRQLHPI